MALCSDTDAQPCSSFGCSAHKAKDRYIYSCACRTRVTECVCIYIYIHLCENKPKKREYIYVCMCIYIHTQTKWFQLCFVFWGRGGGWLVGGWSSWLHPSRCQNPYHPSDLSQKLRLYSAVHHVRIPTTIVAAQEQHDADDDDDGHDGHEGHRPQTPDTSNPKPKPNSKTNLEMKQPSETLNPTVEAQKLETP